MARRPDPERIYQARRSGHLARLKGEGELPDRAEAWIARWEAHADAQGRPHNAAYWDGAWEWISARQR